MTDLEIINLYKQGKSCRAIEREYGISRVYLDRKYIKALDMLDLM